MDVEKAVTRNRHFMSVLGWKDHRAAIVELLRLGATPDERRFAESVGPWQASRGMDIDGIVGPVTWAAMASFLGLGIRYGQWRPLGTQIEPKIRKHDIVCLHTMDGTVDSTDKLWRRNQKENQAAYKGVESHFGVGHDGSVVQWQDTRFQADANSEGSYRVISIETEDRGPAFPQGWSSKKGDVPAWTNAQIEAIAHLVARCFLQYKIPIELIADTRPERRGIGYHRQGIQDRVPGGEKWSQLSAKACPGARRIAQIPRVLERAQDIARILIRFQP